MKKRGLLGNEHDSADLVPIIGIEEERTTMTPRSASGEKFIKKWSSAQFQKSTVNCGLLQKTAAAFADLILNDVAKYGLLYVLCEDILHRHNEFSSVTSQTVQSLLCSVVELCTVKNITEKVIPLFFKRQMERALRKSKQAEESVNKEKTEEQRSQEEMNLLVSLLRGEGVVTSICSLFFFKVGKKYLRTLLEPVLSSLRFEPTSLEVDPDKTNPQSAKDATEKLIVMLESFVDWLEASITTMPMSIRCTLASIANILEEKGYGDIKLPLVSTLFFLRFVCPALITPHVHKIVKKELPPALRRSLILFTKVIQNAANDVLFGGKESYMKAFNPFLLQNRPKMQSFLNKIIESGQRTGEENQNGGVTPSENSDLVEELSMIHHGELVLLPTESVINLRNYFVENHHYIFPKYVKMVMSGKHQNKKIKPFICKLAHLAVCGIESTDFLDLQMVEKLRFTHHIHKELTHSHDNLDSNHGGHNLIPVPGNLSNLFAQAEEFVEKYISQLIRDPKQGLITIGSDRFTLLRGRSLSAEFVLIVEQQFGIENMSSANDFAFNLLYELGFCMSKNLCTTFRERYSIYDPSVLYAIGASLFTYLGFASVEVLSGTNPSTSPEDCRMFYHHAKCFEADAWKETMIIHEKKGIPENPICVLQAGNWTGWTVEALGIDLVCAEVQCRARNEPACQYIIAPPAYIPQLIAQHMDKHSSNSGISIPRFLNERMVLESHKPLSARAGHKQSSWFKSAFAKKKHKEKEQPKVRSRSSSLDDIYSSAFSSSETLLLDKGDMPEIELEEISDNMQERAAKYYQKLNLRPQEGKMELEGDRHVLYHSNALSYEFFQMIQHLFGEGKKKKERATKFSLNFLFELAISLGRTDRRHFAQITGLENSEKLAAVMLTSFPIIMTYTGWGRVSVLDSESCLKFEDKRLFKLVYETSNSFESQSWIESSKAHATHHSHLHHPVCIMAAGYAVGWCQESVDFELASVELCCRALGHSSCQFVLASVEVIEKHAKSFLKGKYGHHALQSHQLAVIELVKRRSKCFHSRVFG